MRLIPEEEATKAIQMATSRLAAARDEALAEAERLRADLESARAAAERERASAERERSAAEAVRAAAERERGAVEETAVAAARNLGEILRDLTQAQQLGARRALLDKQARLGRIVVHKQAVGPAGLSSQVTEAWEDG